MQPITSLFTSVVVAASLLAGAGAASAAAVVKTQPPCLGPCASFTPTNPIGALPAVRSFVFAAPSKGTAIVTFHGRLFCRNSDASPNSFTLYSQIVEGGASANEDGPGGAVMVFSLEPNQDTTLNLASTRVFVIAAAGPKVYRFRIVRHQMFANTSCAIFDSAAFTVNFIP